MEQFNNDIELVRRLQTGDTEAFDLIYEKYSGRLYLFALKYLKSDAEAEDLVQSVFLKIWENHNNLKKESSFKSYLFTIAYNNICKLFRKRNYLQKFISDTLYENYQSSSETEDKYNYQSVQERVQQIIDSLPEKQKTIFQKSREEGKTTKEIAREMNLSGGTINNYISETLKLLRSRLCNDDLALLLFVSLFYL